MKRKVSLIKSLDWWTIAIYIVMVIAGWVTIYAACYDFEHPEIFNFSMRHGMQLIWISCAAVLSILVLLIDGKFYNNIAYLFYGLMIVVLVATIFISPDIKGSHSWIKIGSFSIQPAEFAKFATALCLAKFMSSYQFNLHQARNIAIIATIICLPMLIIVGQSETGSALVFAAFLLVLFREGMDGSFLMFGFIIVLFFILVLRFNNIPLEVGELPSVERYGYIIVFVLAIIIGAILIKYYLNDIPFIKLYIVINIIIYFIGGIINLINASWISHTNILLMNMTASILLLITWSVYKRRKTYFMLSLFLIGTIALCYSADYAFNKILEPHQQIRIKIVLGLEDDPQGAGYNVRQSQIAIGSGGFIGKGFLNGTQTKLNYVPEQDTDFIFCTIGEEKGFIGTFFVVALFVILLIRLIILAERQRSPFSRIYGYSVVSILFFHFCVNIGMVIGLVPVIGIPLPFFSYGGSSMWGFTILLFTFIRLDANRMEVLQQ
ncbi:MAG: rod shape-determining protein RodA [Paludibacteraceae bacterium]|jgi:rod shape determining protein RodA|nr:rod shape-determining protein RodA [Paludibacteraceae bacterium]HPG55000.1 rod shape-determining protein RodA [Candidatus Enterocola sp.]